MPRNEIDVENKEAPRHSKTLLWGLVFFLVVAIDMAWTLNYRLPSGNTIGVLGFVALWSRELAILGLVALALIVRFFQRSRK